MYIQESLKNLTQRSFVLVLRKKEKKAEYWPRLTKEKVRNAFIKTDFSKWVDEDEQDEKAALDDDFDMGGMDMGGMGGMGGMPGMGGMGGMGMGGMGMGGMGGMMGGMNPMARARSGMMGPGGAMGAMGGVGPARSARGQHNFHPYARS